MFKDEVTQIVGSLGKVDKDSAKQLYQENPELKDILIKHYLEWNLYKDRSPDVKKYFEHFGLPDRIDGKLIDFHALTPVQKRTFKWFIKGYNQMDTYKFDDFKTMKTV